MGDNPIQRLFDLPHDTAKALLSSGVPVYLPVNPVEYHGSHLPLHTDHLISVGLIRDLHAALAPDRPLLVASDLEVGVDPVPGPGTRAVPFRAVRALVVRACHALADLGAKRVVLMTFHGSPLHSIALEAGVRALRARGVPAIAPLNLLLARMLEIGDEDLETFRPAVEHIADREVQDTLLAELPHDYHAGFFETSLVLHYAAESVARGYDRVPSCPSPRPDPVSLAAARAAGALGAKRLARDLGFAARGLGWYALRPFPGYTGRPQHATPSAGAFFARQIVEQYTERARAVLFEGAEPPPPIMRWTAWVTIGGRLGGIPAVPEDAIGLPAPATP